MAKPVISFNVLAEADKPAFPGKYFNDCLFDLQIFNMADNLVPGYNGGNWEYVEAVSVSDEASIVIPFFELKNCDTIRNPFSGEEFKVDTALAGMIITSYAMVRALEKTMSEEMSDRWYHLRNLIYDYAGQTDQTSQAFGMMD